MDEVIGRQPAPGQGRAMRQGMQYLGIGGAHKRRPAQRLETLAGQLHGCHQLSKQCGLAARGCGPRAHRLQAGGDGPGMGQQQGRLLAGWQGAEGCVRLD